MIRLTLFLLPLTLCACATNPGLDHRIACIDGKANVIFTYGPAALTNSLPDADALCPPRTIPLPLTSIIVK